MFRSLRVLMNSLSIKVITFELMILWYSQSFVSADVFRLERQTIPAMSVSRFDTIVDVAHSGTASLHTTITNGRGQPFEMLHVIRGDWSSSPATLSLSTLRLEGEDGSFALQGLGTFSTVVDDAHFTLDGFSPGGTQELFPDIQSLGLFEAFDRSELDEIALALGQIQIQVGGFAGELAFVQIPIPEPPAVTCD